MGYKLMKKGNIQPVVCDPGTGVGIRTCMRETADADQRALIQVQSNMTQNLVTTVGLAEQLISTAACFQLTHSHFETMSVQRPALTLGLKLTQHGDEVVRTEFFGHAQGFEQLHVAAEVGRHLFHAKGRKGGQSDNPSLHIMKVGMFSKQKQGQIRAFDIRGPRNDNG